MHVGPHSQAKHKITTTNIFHLNILGFFTIHLKRFYIAHEYIIEIYVVRENSIYQNITLH